MTLRTPAPAAVRRRSASEGEAPVSDGLRINHGVLVRAPRALVFDALATRSGLEAWFATEVTLEPWSGGQLSFVWRDYGPDHARVADHGTVVAYERPDALIFDWHPREASGRTRVTISLSDAIGGTRVDLLEEGFSDSDRDRRTCIDNALGWGEALANLRWHVEPRAATACAAIPLVGAR